MEKMGFNKYLNCYFWAKIKVWDSYILWVWSKSERVIFQEEINVMWLLVQDHLRSEYEIDS